MNEIQEEFEELTSEFLFGIITPEKEIKLKSILSTNPELEMKFREYLKLHSRIVNSEEIWENENSEPGRKTVPFYRMKKFRYFGYAAAAVILSAAAFNFFLKERPSSQKKSVSYFSRVLNFYADCRLNGKQVETGMEIQLNEFAVRSGKHSYCLTESAGGHRIVLELEPESEMQISLNERSAEISLLKGKLKIDSEKIQNDSVLTARTEDLKIEFLGTKLFLRRDSDISALTVLKGSVKAVQPENRERIIAENESEKFNHSRKEWTSEKMSDSETAKLKREFDELIPVSPNELRKGNYGNQSSNIQYSRRVSEKMNAQKISQVSGRKVRLKNGKTLAAETIFQEEDRYIIITKDDIFHMKDTEVDAILFQ